jgi:hypothetical protein
VGFDRIGHFGRPGTAVAVPRRSGGAPSPGRRRTVAGEEIDDMLWTIFVVLLVLWALGMVSSYTIGGYIHILLVIAIAVVLIRIIQGRRPV